MKHPDGDVEVKYSMSGVESVNQPQILENNVLDQWRELMCILKLGTSCLVTRHINGIGIKPGQMYC